MNIAKNDTVKVNCQPELGEGIVRDIFQIEGGPTNIVVSFGDQGKIDYFFPCELTKVETHITEKTGMYYTSKNLKDVGCPKCGNKTCKCKEGESLESLQQEVKKLYLKRLKSLLETPAETVTSAQMGMIFEMYRLLK